ncbi:hypothetical protein CRM22_004510 [Opisthorchis felineus]|uniref:Neurotransmitter-gated ion-channel ligand-binding domain-containing protein n=1 Tax=Opisthorchis felineus TaxID=147828 RepID=A0A4S2LVT3_OPIFE|nr:hypothetical protein CRM22_004510 [Opisthorchis felineus]
MRTVKITNMWHLVCMIVSTTSIDPTQAEYSERELVKTLLESYDAVSRPVMNGHEIVVVTLGLALQKVIDLDEKNQILYTSLQVQLEWYDEVLARGASRHIGDALTPNGNRRLNDSVAFEEEKLLIILPADKLWTPDLYVYNNGADGANGLVYVRESWIRVYTTGRVRWNLPINIQSACNVNIFYFPFDRQVCELQLASWTYDKSQLTLKPKTTSTEEMLEWAIDNAEFAVTGAQLILNNRTSFDKQEFSQVTLRLHIERRALFYGYTVIAPSVLLCILTICSFCLPCGNAKKVEIGLTVFLFLYFLQVTISEHTPESSTTPLINLFLTLVMSLSSFSIICATCVLNVIGRSHEDPCPAPSSFVWFVATQVFGRMTFMSYSKRDEKLYIATQKDMPENSANSPSLEEHTNCNKVNSVFDDISTARRFMWIHVARVTDRLLLLLYLMMTFLLLFMFLVYIPASSAASAL